MSTFNKYGYENPTFIGYTNQTNSIIKTDDGKQVYLGFEDIDKLFNGRNNISENIDLYDNDYSDKVNGLTVTAYPSDNTNTGSELRYTSTTYVHKYQVAYKGIKLFQLDIRGLKKSNIYLTLFDFSGIQFNDESEQICVCLFNQNFNESFMIDDLNSFDVMDLTLQNRCVFLTYTSDNSLHIDTAYEFLPITSNNINDIYDLTKYGKCNVYTINNEKVYTNTTGNNWTSIDSTKTYYLYYYESDGYMKFLTSYKPSDGRKFLYTYTN